MGFCDVKEGAPLGYLPAPRITSCKWFSSCPTEKAASRRVKIGGRMRKFFCPFFGHDRRRLKSAGGSADLDTTHKEIKINEQ